MATGMDWVLNTLFDRMGIDPETGKKQLAESLSVVLTLKAQLDRIEANQLALSAYLKPPEFHPVAQITLSSGNENGRERERSDYAERADSFGAGEGAGGEGGSGSGSGSKPTQDLP